VAYAEQVPAFIARDGGRYIVRGVLPEVIAAQQVIALRHKSAVSKLVLVEGVSSGGFHTLVILYTGLAGMMAL
jgi:uncharacterized protein (DUF1330 family)